MKTFIPVSKIFGNEDDIEKNKKIKSEHIMKNQLYTNVAKDNR